MIDPNLLEDVLEEALPLERYVPRMEKYQKRMRARLETVRLSQEVHDRLETFSHIHHVLVLTEDWCGDSVLNIPIVARMVTAMPSAELRVAYRHRHPTLQERLEALAVTKVPVVIFMDSEFHVHAVWDEHPELHDKQFEVWKRDNPRFEEIKADPTLSQDERKKVLEPFYARLLLDMHEWYDGELDFQGAAVDEMMDALAVRKFNSGVSNP